jgi:hypothetical protein
MIHKCFHAYLSEWSRRLEVQRCISKTEPCLEIGKIKDIEYRVFKIYDQPACMPQGSAVIFFFPVPVMKRSE